MPGIGQRRRRDLVKRRDDRVVEGACLETLYTARYPGLESLPFRHRGITPPIECAPQTHTRLVLQVLEFFSLLGELR
jgi:hypothetical protein